MHYIVYVSIEFMDIEIHKVCSLSNNLKLSIIRVWAGGLGWDCLTATVKVGS